MKRRILSNKANRPLSRRGQKVGKDGHFVGALIGLAGSVAGHFIGKAKAEKETAALEAEETADLLAQGQEMQGQQDIMDAQHSQSVLATYNPQGSAQMYARNGAKIPYNRGGLGYQTGGPIRIEDMEFVTPETGSGRGVNYLGTDRGTEMGLMLGDLPVDQAHAFRRSEEFMDPRTGEYTNFGTYQDSYLNDRTKFNEDFKSNKELYQKYGGDSDKYYQEARRLTDQNIQRRSAGRAPDRFPAYTADDIASRSQATEESLGSTYSNFEKRLNEPVYQGGGQASMYDKLQDVDMQEYQSYQTGGTAQVPGGELEQVSERAQVVHGDNPGMIDDVELGTNPGEPQAMVDANEVIVDAVDEQGQPYKQIFSDTVLVPGKNISMAKEAKKLLKQVPKDEESEQAERIYSKLNSLFETQQMLNGDSQGEDPQEAAAGGMDPNAAQEMGQEGTQAFQYGGSDYYNEGMREEMMQVPYPKKRNLQGGGFLSGALDDLGGGSGLSQVLSGVTKGLSAGMKGYGTGYGMGMSDTGAGKTGYGMMAAQNMLGDIGGAATGIQDSLAARKTGQEEERNALMEQQAQIGGNNFGQSESGYGNSNDPFDQRNFEHGGSMYEDYGMRNSMMGEPMSMEDMYAESKNFTDYYEEVYKLPNTLSDMQTSANAKGWGHLSTENGLRRSSNLMGRLHRGQAVDSTPVISPSERGGPTPMKRKGYVMGGVFRYSISLKSRSLTLSIL